MFINIISNAYEYSSKELLFINYWSVIVTVSYYPKITLQIKKKSAVKKQKKWGKKWGKKKNHQKLKQIMGKKVVWKKVEKKNSWQKSAVEKKGGGKKKSHKKVEKKIL